MPKVIENLENSILTQANIQLFEKGYQEMTMRSVANACGIAVGTVYNYYKSKDELVAKIMLVDWDEILRKVKLECKNSSSIHEGFKYVYDGVASFSAKYDDIWTQYGKMVSVKTQMPTQFDWLVKQLAEILDEILVRCHDEKDPYLGTFLAEILLNSAAKKDFEYDNIARILNRMF